MGVRVTKRSSHVVLVGDLVGSRDMQARQRQKLQVELAKLLQALSVRYESGLQTPLAIVGGDGFQVVVKNPSVVVEMTWDFWSAFPDGGIRLGVGFGEIFTQLGSKDPRLMDGPAFHRAAEIVKRSDGISFLGFGTSEDIILDGLGALLDTVFQRFTSRQRETLALLHKGIPQARLVEQFSISKQAVSRRVLGSGWHAYRDGENALREALELFSRPRRAEG